MKFALMQQPSHMWWSLAVAGQTLLVTSLFTAGTCFGIDTLVTTGSGKQKLMKDLRIGEEVLSDETGSMTKVLGWLELNSKKKVSFLKINTHDAEELIMTGTHIVR